MGIALLGDVKAVVAVVLVFLGTIVIHEFGHFIVAKWCGVAVPTFSVGFGPKLVTWFRNGTEYSIRPYLFGGFVQLAGEVPQDSLFRKGEEISVVLDDSQHIIQVGEPSDVPDGHVFELRDLDLTRRMHMTLADDSGVYTFPVKPYARLMTNARSSMPIVEPKEQMLAKPLWQRASIILAGPVMNFLLAGVLFAGVFSHMGVPVTQPVLGSIETGSPAQAAGLSAGDRVISVNGSAIDNWNQFVAAIQGDTTKPPKPLNVTLVHDGQTESLNVTPRLTSSGTPQLGIHQATTFSPARTIPSGFTTVYQMSASTLHVLWQQVLVHHQYQNLSGPVGIADVIGQQAHQGIWNVLMIAGMLSLNLGLMNLLPIPALDGGRLLFMLIELVRGRGLDPRKEGFVHIVGFALLILFGVMITYRDVLHLF